VLRLKQVNEEDRRIDRLSQQTKGRGKSSTKQRLTERRKEELLALKDKLEEMRDDYYYGCEEDKWRG